MAMAGLYRRILPSPPAIDFASAEGKLLFSEAFQNGAMEGFFKLISYFQTQSEPAYCGLASLSMVLNALAIDPGRKWKGPWRWFDESMLDCCEPLEKVKAEGISFGKVVCLAQCAGAKVDAFRTNQSTIEDFRKFVIACTARDDCHVVSSYDRGKFKQTGSGHFSPIGGYHAGKDMALILDVARFKYPPHWVPVTLLWEAMNTVDKASGLHRGFMLVSRLHRAPALLFTLSCKHESWIKIAKYLVEDVPFLLGSEDVRDIKKAISVLLSSLPSDFGEFIKWVAEVRRQENGGGQSLSQEEIGRIADKEEVLKQVQETGLYTLVTEFLLSEQQTSGTATFTSLGNKLPEVAAKVCCQGAGFFSGMPSSLNSLCCRQTCVRCFQYTGENPVTVVSGTVVNENGEQGIDMLVPSSPRHKKRCDCKPDDDALGMYPMSNDILTVLLLALPPQTWSGIQEEKLLQEIQALVSTENLPMLLQEEVLHLRRQLHILERCKDNKNGHSLPYTISEDAKHTTMSHITEGNKGEASVFHQNFNCSLKCHIIKGVRVANPGKLVLCGSSGIILHLLSASSRFKCISTCGRPGFEKPFVCLRSQSPL